MNECPIYAIPGFLGLPSDWKVFNKLPLVPINHQDYCWNSLKEWAHDFNQKQLTPKQAILMGYSLGGRLALHALLDAPAKWKGAIIISSHYGLEDPSLRQQRLIHDEKWAHRFETEPWEQLMQSWNAQHIFKNEASFQRLEESYCRQQLAQVLRKSSLGVQENLKDKIDQLNIPILWITGANDQKYCKLAATLNFTHPLSQKMTIQGAGHRAPWKDSKTFQQVIKTNKLAINDTL